MKRILGIFLLYISSFTSMAQHSLTLSGYTYSDKNKVIGTVEGTDKSIVYTGFTLKGPATDLFTISKKGQLRLRSIVTDRFWQEVIIEAKSPAGVVVTDTFRIVKDQFIQNKVIAHRGAWKKSGTSENSLAALRNAITLGCMGSELDVHLSADSVLFVNHDPVIQGVSIEKTASSELLALKLSNGETLPTLESYLLEGMKQNHTRLIVEIKPSAISKSRSLILTQKVVDLVRDMKAQAWVEYISFDYDVCKKVKSLEPYAKVAYLNGDQTPEQLAADQIDGLDYHFSVLQKNESWFEMAQQKKVSINVWTVNEKNLMEWLLQKKVDFITTNEPELLLELIR